MDRNELVKQEIESASHPQHNFNQARAKIESNPYDDMDGDEYLDHNIQQYPDGMMLHSAEKMKGSMATNTTNASLHQSGDPETKRREAAMEAQLNDLPLINPLLYKPASKPPVIKEGDWLCPHPKCSNINWAKRIYCNRCGIQRPNLDKIKSKSYMMSKLYEDANWPCPGCKNINRADRDRCRVCGDFRSAEMEGEIKKHNPNPDIFLPQEDDFQDGYNNFRGGYRGRGGRGGGRGGSRGFSGGSRGFRGGSRGGRGGFDRNAGGFDRNAGGFDRNAGGFERRGGFRGGYNNSYNDNNGGYRGDNNYYGRGGDEMNQQPQHHQDYQNQGYQDGGYDGRSRSREEDRRVNTPQTLIPPQQQ